MCVLYDGWKSKMSASADLCHFQRKNTNIQKGKIYVDKVTESENQTHLQQRKKLVGLLMKAQNSWKNRTAGKTEQVV